MTGHRTDMPRLESGRGNGVQDYLAFWTDATDPTQARVATAVRVSTPPHEQARGTILEEYIVAALAAQAKMGVRLIRLLGAVSLYGSDREIVLGDGRAACATFTPDGWRVGP